MTKSGAIALVDHGPRKAALSLMTLTPLPKGDGQFDNPVSTTCSKPLITRIDA
jgi:hypothetical protein